MSPHTNETQRTDRVIYRSDLCKMLGVGSEAMRRWMKAGKVPPPDVAISRRTVGWRLSTLQAAGIGLV
ncbi:helix-turn-helix transcriptional regulator [Variovorax boronicumulans]|uniref:helix-turn-helix transcriptional regulator n=1 Tax=Variovorax boronicumulans TaxID=436515 RepID=UPI001C569842